MDENDIAQWLLDRSVCMVTDEHERQYAAYVKALAATITEQRRIIESMGGVSPVVNCEVLSCHARNK